MEVFQGHLERNQGLLERSGALRKKPGCPGKDPSVAERKHPQPNFSVAAGSPEPLDIPGFAGGAPF